MARRHNLKFRVYQLQKVIKLCGSIEVKYFTLDRGCFWYKASIICLIFWLMYLNKQGLEIEIVTDTRTSITVLTKYINYPHLLDFNRHSTVIGVKGSPIYVKRIEEIY